MNYLTKRFFWLTIIVFSLFSCKKEELDESFSGTLVNAFTREPVIGATVRVIDDGPERVTDGNGTFRFDRAEMEAASKVGSSIAISFLHDDYRPREANMSLSGGETIEIAPMDIPAYFYFQPVQLNDGLATAALEQAGVNRQQIHGLMEEILGDGFSEIHSLLVYKNDHLVIEEYFFGNNDTIQFENNISVDESRTPIQWRRNQPHYVASVNKALTSSLLGIALSQNQIPIETKISEYLPDYSEYFADSNKAELDFRSCVTMTAGFTWDEWGQNDLSLLWQSQDFADFVLQRQNMGIGSEWRYNSALPNLMIKAMDEMVGGNFRHWAQENFYDKLGVSNFRWQSQPDGFPEGAARMFIRPRDMLKVGITYLDEGIWAGEQVIPKEWVEECFEVKNQTTSGDYSYYFWLRELEGKRYLSADGDGGNYINIFPDEDMVIVITQGHYLKWPHYVNQANDIMGNHLFPAME